MKSKKAIRFIAFILVLLMILPFLFNSLSAYAVTQDEIDALQSQKNELSEKVSSCKERLTALQSQQANVLEQRAAILEENKLTQEQIDLVQEQIDIYEDMISEQSELVEEAKTREDRQLQKYRTRVRAMEENGEMNILALILQTSSLSELMSAVDDMGEIMQSDKLLEEQYVAAREETEEIKAEYEAVKAEYEGKQDELRSEQEELKAQMEEANKVLEDLSEEIEKAIEEYKAAEAEESAAAAQVSALIAEWDKQKAEQAAASATQVVNEDGTVTTVTDSSTTVTGTGSFIWPVPCSMRVTSRYGNRSDPFTGETKYHSGIDIDGFGNDGQPVIAADSGTVITASSNSGYGNYVIIDHGSTKTLYAHMSGLAVSSGQTVTQGQTVGYLGATGRATGTHLHFEVYVGEGRVDPASYFSGITYYNC
jgi:murein DD-endopeptidase MepM/ murein hydrolase activator NlpD